MDSFVTARVPAEIKEQGNAILEKLGSSPTKLVNAAYEYVLAEGAIPQPSSRAKEGKALDGEALERLVASLQATTFEVPESFWEGRSYKELLEEGRRADYEALS